MNQQQKSLIGTVFIFAGGAVGIYLVSGFALALIALVWATLVSLIATAAFIVLVVVVLAAISSSSQARPKPDPTKIAHPITHQMTLSHRPASFAAGKPVQTKHGDLRY
jgi:heme/copper-type cytochrome/quinol oxidase subunit 2